MKDEEQFEKGLKEEIKEILLHATIYCGVPAGLDAFKIAHEVLKAEGAIP